MIEQLTNQNTDLEENLAVIVQYDKLLLLPLVRFRLAKYIGQQYENQQETWSTRKSIPLFLPFVSKPIARAILLHWRKKCDKQHLLLSEGPLDRNRWIVQTKVKRALTMEMIMNEYAYKYESMGAIK